jgi:hypothetical protein
VVNLAELISEFIYVRGCAGDRLCSFDVEEVPLSLFPPLPFGPVVLPIPLSLHFKEAAHGFPKILLQRFTFYKQLLPINQSD